METWYQKTDGTWTKTAPSGDDQGYAKNSLGKYITEVRANTAGAAALNAYLGAFGSNDTFALIINEQTKTTDSILTGLSSMEENNSNAETITRGTVGAFPNSEYLKQNSASKSEGNGSSEGQGEYEEFSADTKSELFSFSSEAVDILGVEVDGYEVSFSIGLPLYSKNNEGETGSIKNTFDDTKETAGKVKDFIKAIKNKEKAKDALSNLAGDDLDANKLKSKSVEFSVSVTLGITLKYSPLDNKYKFSEAALAASVGIELRLQYRFTPVPILYVYAQFGAEASIQTGLGQERDVKLGQSITEPNKTIELYEVPKAGQSRQYYFTSNMKAFNITFSGKLYMECYEFTDANGNGYYDEGDVLGDVPSGFNAGYLSSDGKEPTEVILKMQNDFRLSKSLVVVFTVMDDKNDNNNAKATISSIVLIEGVEQDLFWEGFQFTIEGSIELGIGIGIEIAKAEIYAKASLGIAFTLGAYDGDKNIPATFDEFSLSAGIGFRVVFLFFNYEQDLIEYHLNYDAEEDKDGQDVVSKSGWSHGWSALGGTFGGDSSLSTQGNEGDGKIHVYITPPSKLRAKVYDNNVTKRKADVEDLAYNTNTDFQVSGYGSSVNAFKLLDNVGTGYDYQIVTVGDDNYVVYTGTIDDPDAAAVDNTELKLSKLLQYDNKYGFVNPIAGNSSNESAPKSIPVDGDGTGDLDFYAWADGKTIHVVWVSYAKRAEPAGAKYEYNGEEMTADNYAAIGKPAGGEYNTDADPDTYVSVGSSLVINGNAMTASNYNSISLTPVASASVPTLSDYYTADDKSGTEGWTSAEETVGEDTITYWYPSIYGSLDGAKEAYRTEFTKYNNYTAYTLAKSAYDEWINYYEWYNYYSYLNDVRNQVTAASRNTVVKHAAFDTTATAADTKFTACDTLPGSIGQAYYFLPHSEGDVAAYAQSVPYSNEDLTERLNEYEDYLDDVLKAEESDNTETSRQYIAATKQYRLNYQHSLLSVYGGNSKLTITAPDGTSYANGVMYVSKHQENGNGVAENQTNEILTNLELTKVGNTYYLAYATQQDKFEKDGGKYKDICTITRLYLRSFSVEDNDDEEIGAPAKKIVWGDPYLLRTVVNREQDSKDDGIYNASLGLISRYQDPYISNLSFLTGKLGDKLTGEEETFETFGDVQDETFLLFEMNGNTYVIDQASLASITGSEHKGIIHPFFTYQQRYGSALDKASSENLSSGKSEVVIDADGDGNVAAVYTGSVPNTVNNAIYIAYWDPEAGMWSDGVMLAMNYMDVYERSVANGWDAATTEKAYFDVNSGGGMTQFTFSNLQVALGRKTTPSAGTGELSAQGVSEKTEVAAASKYGSILGMLGIHPKAGEAASLSDDYTPAEIYALTEQAELLGTETGSGTANNAELLIITQGSLINLEEYTLGSGKTVIAPKRNAVGTSAEPADVGIYAISYGKGEQQVGNVALNFGYYEFTVGSRLYAELSLKNAGDAAIRGSKDQPVIVKLKLHDDDGSNDTILAQWEISQNIGAGQTVSLATTDEPCKALPTNLGTGDFFYITVEEDEDYIIGNGGTPYSYNSSTDNNAPYRFNIEDKPELGIENLKTKITDVEPDGDSRVELSFDVTNRGKKKAENVFVQFTYVSGYDANGNEVYRPLDLSDSELYVSQQKLINDPVTTLGENDLSKGVIYLGTDNAFYTDDYYITAEKYNRILSNYYSTAQVSGWDSGTYNNVTYWYDPLYYVSAYAAYDAGQKAVKNWKYDNATGNYYNSAYESFTAAKNAADAVRKAEYIITAAQYGSLSESDKERWKAAPDKSGFYIPAGYASYLAAEEAYEAALVNDTRDIDKSYMRNVRGTIYVSPECFNGKVTGSLDLRITVFSGSSNADYNSATGLYSSKHADEYYAANNQVTDQLEHCTFIAAPARITLALGSKHIIPVNIRTTTGRIPSINVTEVDDQNDELSTLYYAADNDIGGKASNASGSLVIVGKNTGSGKIHIIDTATNTVQAVAYTVAEAGEGINIYNDDTQFTFKNADGSLYNEGKPNQSWRFQELSNWTEALAQPYLGNIAIGKKGASFTFETKAGKISMDMIGSAAVTSSKFPGTFTVNNDGITAPPTSKIIDFGNETNVTHTITVTITSDTAYFDILRLVYGSGYVPPSDDTQAPGLYWSRSFPRAGSVAEGNTVTYTVYAIDESGLQSMSFNNSVIENTQISKLSDSLWSYTFTVGSNTDFSVSASDTNGNTTNRRVNADWFAKTVDEEEYGQKPDLNASVYKMDKDGSNRQDIYATGANVTFTVNDLNEERRVELIANENADDTAVKLTYYQYNKENADFVEMTSRQINNNGIYMVRAYESTYGTWSSQIFYVDCFEPMPEIIVSTEKLTDPNGLNVMWIASKDERSTAKLTSVTLNGLDLIPGVNTQEVSYSGSVQVRYGGEYLFEVRDSKDIRNISKQIFTVPVDLSESNIFTSENAWGQPDNNGARYGSITIDFSKITGGSYANPTSIDGNAVPLDEYYGSYEYTVLPYEQCADKLMPGDAGLTDEEDSWLTALNWTAAGHNKKCTADGLTVPAGGSGEYVVIIRDKQNPKQYSAMAVQRITLSDNAIDVVGLSARLASTSTASDGQVYITANKGRTGAYEFAILPLDAEETADKDGKIVYKTRTADDFKQAGVTWKLTDWDSADGNTSTFDGLATGAYQAAVRALYDGTGSEPASMDILKTLNHELISAGDNLEQLKKDIGTYTSSMVNTIYDASTAWSNAGEETEQKKTTYDTLYERLTKGDTTVTNAMVDDAYTAWQDAITAENEKEAAYKAKFVGAAQEELDEILELRTAWLDSDIESREAARKSYEDKVSAWCTDYQQALHAGDLETAQRAFDDANSDYDTKAEELRNLSAAEYSADSKLWDGMIVSGIINVKQGTATSLRATPYVTSSGSRDDGRIVVKANGGSAYDNGNAVHYQFAVLPLENEKAAVDYSGNMSAIADLNLDWQFADDPAADPGIFTKYGLSSGWYQIFVRMVYDPDVKDDYDVNTNLFDPTGKTTDLSKLRKDYDAAKKAAEAQSVDAQAAQAHAHYTKYLSTRNDADYQAYLAAIGHDSEVLTALNAWKNSDPAGKTAAFSAYESKLREYFDSTAQENLKAATLAYLPKLDELNKQIDEAYSRTPGYYDTVSFTNAFVGVAPVIIGQTGSVTYADGEAIYKISSDGTLTLQDKQNIFEDSKKMRVRLIIDSLQIIVPAGALNEASDVSDVVNSFKEDSGNVVVYIDEKGQMIINPISVVGDDKIAYVYLGKGVYTLKQSDSSFTDISGHWANDSILFVTNRGLFRGVTQDRFAPNETMTRAMLVTVLYRMMGQPKVNGKSTFSDVPSGNWYADAVSWAQANNIINGISETQFAPDLSVNREQLVAILYRFLLSKGFGAPEKGSLSQYPDEGSIANYAKDAFKWAVEAGIVNGTDKGMLIPQNDATRAQVAAVFERMIRYILK